MGTGKSVIKNLALKVEWELVRLTWVREIIFLHPPAIPKHLVSTQYCIMPSRYTEGGKHSFWGLSNQVFVRACPSSSVWTAEPAIPLLALGGAWKSETGSRNPPPSSSMFTSHIYICTYREEWYLLNRNIDFTWRTLVLPLLPAAIVAKLLGVENGGQRTAGFPNRIKAEQINEGC